MSACNGFTTSTAAYLFTDAAAYAYKNFDVLALMNKTLLLPQCRAAIGATGNTLLFGLIAGAFYQSNLDDFDDLVSNAPDILQKHFQEFVAGGPSYQRVLENFRIAFAGWSNRVEAPALYCLQGEDGIGVRAFEITPTVKFVNPAAAHGNDRSILDIEFDPRQPAVSGLNIMRAQREKLKSGIHHGVGGWCQMTTITRDAIETRVLERWREDKIGQPITPAVPVRSVGNGTFGRS